MWWVLLAGLYVALISTITGWELLTGLTLGLLIAILAVATRSAERKAYRPSWAWLGWLLPLPGAVVVDTGRLALVLAQRVLLRRDVRGSFRRVQLPRVDDGPRDAARRALASVALSATPGTVVVDVDSDNGVLLHC